VLEYVDYQLPSPEMLPAIIAEKNAWKQQAIQTPQRRSDLKSKKLIPCGR
jgi:hypothetical protein